MNRREFLKYSAGFTTVVAAGAASAKACKPNLKIGYDPGVEYKPEYSYKTWPQKGDCYIDSCGLGYYRFDGTEWARVKLADMAFDKAIRDSILLQPIS